MDFTRAGKLARSHDALPYAYEALSKLREQRSRLISRTAGPDYPHSTKEAGWSTYDDILGLLRKAAEANAITLAADRPRFQCSSPLAGREAFTANYEVALNAYAKNMRLEEALRDCVMNAFYSLGIAKVYMAESVPVMLETDEWMDPGRPYCQSISPHHFVYDTSATHWRYCSFLADRYRVRFKDVVSDTRFTAAVRKKIREQGPLTRRQLDEAEHGRSLAYDDTDLEPMLFLADVFITDEMKVYTYVVDSDFRVTVDQPLGIVDWTGQETGPYHFLNLGPVPDKTTPSAPAQQLLLLHDLCNSLYRQLQRQARNQKTINVAPAQYEKEIQAARDADDDAFLAMDAEIQQYRTGGPDQNVFSFLANAMMLYDEQAGNLKFRLGLGQSADTASQEGFISQNVSRAEGYSRTLFYAFVRGIAQELGRLLFESPTTDFAAKRRIDDYISVDAPWKGAVEEGSRMGEFFDYDIDVDMTPMAYKSPGEKVMELQQTFGEIMQLAPITMQMGMMPDIQYYLKEKSRLLNNSCLERLLVPVVPPEQGAGGGHERSLAPGGPHVYEHRSSGGGGGDPWQQQIQAMGAANADNAA